MKNQIIILLNFLCIAYVANAQTNTAWNEVSRRQVFDFVLNDIKSFSLTQTTKQLFAKKTVANVEKALPQGLQSVDSDRLKSILLAAGKDTFNELNSPSRGYWILAREDAMYKSTQKMVAQSFNAKSVNELTDCLMSNIMKTYPNGLGNLSEKERLEVVYKIGYDCGWQSEVDVIKWSKLTEDAMKVKIMEYLKQTQLNEQQKNYLTNCVINTMKLKHPDGLKGNLEKEFEEVTIKCIDML